MITHLLHSAAGAIVAAAETPALADGDDTTIHPMLSSSHLSSAELEQVGMTSNHKTALWTTYIIFNGLGCLLCACLMVAVYRMSRRTASDVLAGALCLSCFVMSISCGMQCLLNASVGHFAYGSDACYAEAFFHLISIVSMFFVLTLMAHDSHRTVVKGESMGVKKALWSVLGVWALSLTGVGLFSLGSPIYMAPSGVFCFFAFDSLLMYAFFLPAFLIAVAAMVYYYARIFAITHAALARMGSTLNVTDNRKRIQMRLAQKLFLFVVVFLAGWVTLVLGIIVQLATGDMMELDAIGGVFGVIHSLAVPITYGLINPRLRNMMLNTMTCGAWTDGLASTRDRASKASADDSHRSLKLSTGAASQEKNGQIQLAALTTGSFTGRVQFSAATAKSPTPMPRAMIPLHERRRSMGAITPPIEDEPEVILQRVEPKTPFQGENLVLPAAPSLVLPLATASSSPSSSPTPSPSISGRSGSHSFSRHWSVALSPSSPSSPTPQLTAPPPLVTSRPQRPLLRVHTSSAPLAPLLLQALSELNSVVTVVSSNVNTIDEDVVRIHIHIDEATEDATAAP